MRVELPARMELGEDDLHARDLHLGMDVRGNSSAVVLHGGAPVLVEDDFDLVRKAVCRLVDRVVHNLPEDMVKPLAARRADVHAGTQPHRLEPFENGDVPRIIMICRHSYLEI